MGDRNWEDPYQCPVATAIRECFPGPGELGEVQVANSETRLVLTREGEPETYSYHHSQRLREWITGYDNDMGWRELAGGEEEPFRMSPIALDIDGQMMEIRQQGESF